MKLIDSNVILPRDIVLAPGGWVKSHGLGNDYLVLRADGLGFPMTPEAARRICHRNYGVGSDGILLLTGSERADFGLTIYNPDGSTAEKSGNGLRIFADYLYHFGLASGRTFTVEVGGAIVRCDILDDGQIGVDIGRATFVPAEIPVDLPGREEALDYEIEAGGERLTLSSVSVGNPHAVRLASELRAEDILRLGPLVETHPLYPNRTNVQFVRVLDRRTIAIEIWERGAGHTLASGSSSCAAAAVCRRKGLVDGDVTVRMPGGTLLVSIGDDYDIRLTGPVTRIACGLFLG